MLLLISTTDLDRWATQHTTAVAAAARTGIGRVVYTSMSNPFADFPKRLRQLAAGSGRSGSLTRPACQIRWLS